MADWTDLLARSGQSNGLADFLEQQANNVVNRQQAQAQTQLFNQQQTDLIAKAQRQQQRDADVNYMLSIQDPLKQNQAVLDLIAKYPEEAQAYGKVFDGRDGMAKSSNIQWAGDTIAAIDNKKYDIAANNIRQRIAADEAAGADTTADRTWLAAIEKGDLPSIAYVRGGLAAAVGASSPDHFDKLYDSVGGQGSSKRYVVGRGLVDNEGKLLYRDPDPAQYRTINGTDADGNPTTSVVRVGGGGGYQNGTLANGGAPGNAVPMTVEGLKPLFTAQESGGDYTAVNKQTGALGRYQVMRGTGAALARKNGMPWRPDLMSANTPEAQQYQDAIGNAAIQDAIDNSRGNLATAFGYYYSGTADRSKWGPKTKRYVTEMVSRSRAVAPQATDDQNAPQGNGQVVYTQRGVSKGAPATMGDPTLSGDDYLNSLPAGQRAAVRAIAEGRVAPPKAGTRNGEAMLDAVTRYDPTFDAANAQSRAKTRIDFTSGKSMQNITAMNTAIGHLIRLDGQAKNLGNWSTAPGILNPGYNALRRGLFNNTSLGAFDNSKQSAASELRKVFSASNGGNLAELQSWEAQLSDSSSYEQLHAVIGNAVELLQSRLRALEDQYVQGMGRSDQIPQFINPRLARTANDLFGVDLSSSAPARSGGGSAGGSTPAAAGTQNNPISIRTPQELQNKGLPKGTWVRLPDGRVVPTK